MPSLADLIMAGDSSMPHGDNMTRTYTPSGNAMSLIGNAAPNATLADQRSRQAAMAMLPILQQQAQDRRVQDAQAQQAQQNPGGAGGMMPGNAGSMSVPLAGLGINPWM